MKQPVKEFLNSVTGKRKDLLLELQALIRTLYPQVECLIGYNLFTHRIPTGWVSLGYWENGSSRRSQSGASPKDDCCFMGHKIHSTVKLTA
jgi:hypothetical protein